MIQFLLGILGVLIFLAGSIFIHELGHYLAAKRRGLWIPRFSIGFGPRIFSWKGKETEFCISLIPLGGYVTLPQLADMKSLEGDFGEIPVNCRRRLDFSDRFWVAAMGPIFNLLLAFFLAIILWIFGRPFPQQQMTTQIGAIPTMLSIGGKEEPNPLTEGDLRPGDSIDAVDGHRVRSFPEIAEQIAFGTQQDSAGNPQSELTLRRGKNIIRTKVPVSRLSLHPNLGESMRAIGILPAQSLRISEVMANSPAEKAGILPGDQLLKINDHPLYSPAAVNEIIANDKNEMPLVLQLERDKDIREVSLKPVILPIRRGYLEGLWRGKKAFFLRENAQFRSLYGPKEIQNVALNEHQLREDFTLLREHSPESKAAIGIIFQDPMALVHENPLLALWRAMKSSLRTLESLINPSSEIGVKNLMGVPGIAHTLHRLSTQDFHQLLWFVMLLNIGLAILNLLPIPALDGGQILFAFWEKCTGKPLPAILINGLQSLCMLLLFALMIYISAMDIRRWIANNETQREIQQLQTLLIEPHF